MCIGMIFSISTFPSLWRRTPSSRHLLTISLTFLTGVAIGVFLPYYLIFQPNLPSGKDEPPVNWTAHPSLSEVKKDFEGRFVNGLNMHRIEVTSAKIRSTLPNILPGYDLTSRTPLPAMFFGVGSNRVVLSSSDRYIHEQGVDVLPATAVSPVAPGGTSRASFLRYGDWYHRLPAVRSRPVSAAATPSPSLHPGYRGDKPKPTSNSSAPVAWFSEGLPAVSSTSNGEIRHLVDGVFWTDQVEDLVPKGFHQMDILSWRRFLNDTPVLKVEEGCGRMQNRLVTFDDGRKSCCRYRHNNDQIQGEIFSFYLGRLLNMSNLSPSALALVDTRTKRWSSAASQVSLAQWNSERPVVLTQFVEGLLPAYIPAHFQVKGQRRLHPISEDLGNLSRSDLADLVQWSDLVLFDYITANLDRVVNNMYNERWNADMMRQPTHNLARTKDGLLLFLDNESGLLHGYRLLEKYEHFHRALLDALCIFRKETALAIEKLHRRHSVENDLKASFLDGDPGMADWLPFLPEKSIRTLQDRISSVHEHIVSCKSRFGNSSSSDNLAES